MRHIEVHSYGKCLHNRDEPADLLATPDPRWPALEGPQRRARKVTSQTSQSSITAPIYTILPV